MKKLLSIVAVAAVLSNPVWAESGGSSGMKMQGMGGGMMTHEQMMAMHGHMQRMQELMGKIQGESDPEKRQELMEEHWQAMQDGMHMMNGKGMNMEKGMKMKDGKGKPMAGDMGEHDMMKRMNMMNQRMDMMQMMMGQMMDHQAEERKSKAGPRK